LELLENSLGKCNLNI